MKNKGLWRICLPPGMPSDLTDLRLFVAVADADEGTMTRAEQRRYLLLPAANTRVNAVKVQSDRYEGNSMIGNKYIG